MNTDIFIGIILTVLSLLAVITLTVVNRAFRGLSNPNRCRFLAKNSLTEILRWALAIDSAVAYLRREEAGLDFTLGFAVPEPEEPASPLGAGHGRSACRAGPVL